MLDITSSLFWGVVGAHGHGSVKGLVVVPVLLVK